MYSNLFIEVSVAWHSGSSPRSFIHIFTCLSVSLCWGLKAFPSPLLTTLFGLCQSLELCDLVGCVLSYRLSLPDSLLDHAPCVIRQDRQALLTSFHALKLGLPPLPHLIWICMDQGCERWGRQAYLFLSNFSEGLQTSSVVRLSLLFLDKWYWPNYSYFSFLICKVRIIKLPNSEDQED